MTTHVHHLFDAIRKGRVLAGCWPNTRAKWLKKLRGDLADMAKIPVFVVREDLDSVVDKTMTEFVIERNLARRITMPHPEMIFEGHIKAENLIRSPNERHTDDIWILYACWHDGTEARGDPYIECIMSSTDTGALNEWMICPSIARFYAGSDRIQHGCPFPDDVSPPEGMRKLMADLTDDLIAAVTAFASVLIMMDSPAVELERVQADRKVNRTRRTMGKARVPDHTVLRLPRIVYAGETEHQGGTHKRPRTHWRRPHTRYLRSGKEVHIPLTLIAKKPDEPPPPPPVIEITTRRT